MEAEAAEDIAVEVVVEEVDTVDEMGAEVVAEDIAVEMAEDTALPKVEKVVAEDTVQNADPKEEKVVDTVEMVRVEMEVDTVDEMEAEVVAEDTVVGVVVVQVEAIEMTIVHIHLVEMVVDIAVAHPMVNNISEKEETKLLFFLVFIPIFLYYFRIWHSVFLNSDCR